MNLSISVPISLSIPPIAPDFDFCDSWFSHPATPDLNDCRLALSRLPVSAEPAQYLGLKRPNEPGGLLVVEIQGKEF